MFITIRREIIKVIIVKLLALRTKKLKQKSGVNKDYLVSFVALRTMLKT